MGNLFIYITLAVGIVFLFLGAMVQPEEKVGLKRSDIMLLTGAVLIVLAAVRGLWG